MEVFAGLELFDKRYAGALPPASALEHETFPIAPIKSYI